ncbi:ATP-binding protein [Pseudaeromonas sharmana]|uniref:histidine kinase n=1 Tax=Pseudaeromonas sharmana TaxID=328412 RepID=A0ABV8CN30_9GAMM
MTRRWLPASLTAQVLLLMLGSLILAQVVSIQIYQTERSETLGLVNSRFAMLRLISVVRLLSDTPPELHREILRASRSESLMLRLQADPLLPEERNPRYEQRLRAELNYPQERGIFISVETPDGIGAVRPLRQHFERLHGRPPIRDIRLYGAIELMDGQWLTFSSLADKEPPAWSSRAIISLLLLAAVLAVITTWILRRVTRPLQQLTAQAEQFGRGQTTEPISECGPREVRETLAAFNRMQARLDRFVQDRTQMLAAISHDLRTPLTSLRLRSEFLPDGEDKQKMQETMARMEEMLRATLAFARDDQLAEPSRSIDLDSLLQSLVDDYQDEGAAVNYHAVGQLPYMCHPDMLRRVLQNLIDNALHYAGSADITLSRAPGELYIRIRDHGPGIPEADLEQVFQPFVRLDGARNTESGSVGLGLSIARTLIHRHGGELRLHNHPQGGLEACIQLPE